MKLIPLTKGYFAKVDDDDFIKLNQHNWQYNIGYATRVVLDSELKYQPLGSISMHRCIIDAKKGQMVDHVNGDKLDNRRSNLRLCTNTQNAHNHKINSRNKSGFMGVSYLSKPDQPNRKKWISSISYGGKQTTIGRFDDPVSAAEAYDNRAKEIFGEFARLNFP